MPKLSAKIEKASSIRPSPAGITKDGVRASMLVATTEPEARNARKVSTQWTHSASARAATKGEETATIGNAKQCTMHDALTKVAARSRKGVLDIGDQRYKVASP